jgi:hypothetical protein
MGLCYKTFCRGNLPPFHGNTVILCYKALHYLGNYHEMAVNYHCLMLANLNGKVIYCRILTLENVGTVVNYCVNFIPLVAGPSVIKLFRSLIYKFS